MVALLASRISFHHWRHIIHRVMLWQILSIQLILKYFKIYYYFTFPSYIRTKSIIHLFGNSILLVHVSSLMWRSRLWWHLVPYILCPFTCQVGYWNLWFRKQLPKPLCWNTWASENHWYSKRFIFRSPVRERLQIFLQPSDLYDPEEVLDLMESSEIWLEKETGQ